ncbi:transcriptional repressor LexA [bacterium]|nr:transcriptional repressor LexA [bacterium]
MRLTKKQKQILDFIEEHLRAEGYAPSLREIAAHFGLASVATVHQHVSALEEMGALSRESNRSRSLRPVADDPPPAGVYVPVLGAIAAGRPIPAIETLDDADTIALPEDMIGRGDHFALRVEGDSMIEEGIFDGDLVIARRQEKAENGEVVVALVDEAEATVKRLRRQNSDITLIPANPNLSPVTYSEERVRVQGVVVGLMRKY